MAAKTIRLDNTQKQSQTYWFYCLNSIAHHLGVFSSSHSVKLWHSANRRSHSITPLYHAVLSKRERERPTVRNKLAAYSSQCQCTRHPKQSGDGEAGSLSMFWSRTSREHINLVLSELRLTERAARFAALPAHASGMSFSTFFLLARQRLSHQNAKTKSLNPMSSAGNE